MKGALLDKNPVVLERGVSIEFMCVLETFLGCPGKTGWLRMRIL